MMIVTYWINHAERKMLKRFSDTQADLLVVFGRDMNQPFDHRHTRVTYPTAERLDEAISGMQASTAQAWEDLMNEFLQVNKVKVDIMNVYRQSQYDRGTQR